MDCPICHNESWQAFLVAQDMYTGVDHPIQRCMQCGLARTAGDQTSSSAQSYVYGDSPDAGTRFGPMQWLLRALRWMRARKFVRRRPGRALDVGCGDGSFLVALAQHGWEVFGTELSEAIAMTAKRRLGNGVLVGAIELGGHRGASFDLVTFWHVLEHLDDPQKALAEARRLVKPDGTVVVAVPNVDSLQAHLFKQDWLHLDVPRHRWHFDTHTLSKLAERCDLRVTCIRHFSLEYGPFAIVQGLASKFGLGHALFTRLVRLSPFQLLREPLFWIHLPLVALAIIPSFLLELVAASIGRGGAILVVLRPRQRSDYDTMLTVQAKPTG
jgi:SAM-dependent methyltransferase